MRPPTGLMSAAVVFCRPAVCDSGAVDVLQIAHVKEDVRYVLLTVQPRGRLEESAFLRPRQFSRDLDAPNILQPFGGDLGSGGHCRSSSQTSQSHFDFEARPISMRSKCPGVGQGVNNAQSPAAGIVLADRFRNGSTICRGSGRR